jgi:membrane protein insertase Oxa1/YidC/SpoIIIJ
MEQKMAEIRGRILELQQRYERLRAICGFGARISKESMQSHIEEIQKLEVQLNTN